MNKKFANIIKKIHRHSRGLRDPQIMHPEREWAIGVLLALVIFILSATWSLTLYLKNRNVAVDTGLNEQSESVVYRESMIAEALNRIDERNKVLKSLVPSEAEAPDIIPDAEVIPSSEEASTTTEAEVLVEDTGTTTLEIR